MMVDMVYIVEDDQKIGALIRDFLEASGFSTLQFSDARGVIDAVKRNVPDAIVLDIMLPAGNGLRLAKSIREVSKAPIIMVSARSEEEDKLRALDWGADDYMTKPFSAKELVARVKAQIRRARDLTQGANEVFARLDEPAQRAFWNGIALNLSGSEFAIFRALVRRPEAIHSRDQLLDTLGKRSEESTDRAIDSHIKNIRKKIASVDAEAQAIHSVYGSGYVYKPKRG